VSDVGYGGVFHRKGCENWKDIELARIEKADNATCSALCAKTHGCTSYNLQVSDCHPPEGAGKKGTCAVFGGDCKEATNHCWDLHKVDNPDQAWKISAARQGCKNWEAILIKALHHVSPEQCGFECSKEYECKHFNIQVQDGTHLDGRCPAGGKAKGSCYLFKTGCNPVKNTCWDYYDSLVVHPSTTAAPDHSTTR
jgi:hypothetical protein